MMILSYLCRCFLVSLIQISCSSGAHQNPVKTSNSIQQTPPRILVILSSADTLKLQDGKTYRTGFYFPELMTPLKELRNAGYAMDFANPAGSLPVVDAHSDNASYFGDTPQSTPAQRQAAQSEYGDLRALCEELGLCGAPGTTVGTQRAMKLSDVLVGITRGTNHYAGILVPGGHAPMQDLLTNETYGELLRMFAGTKPIGLICHAPVSLIAAMPDPQRYIDAYIAGNEGEMARQRTSWPFKGQKMAVFTEAEEKIAEEQQLGGRVRYYPDSLLESAGAMIQRAEPWQSNVIVSERLVTGQNPASHTAFAEEYLRALKQVVK
ncbi:MAG: type 1 glutamine amidotransferase domain-containing protein [Myxococcota bacterium]